MYEDKYNGLTYVKSTLLLKAYFNKKYTITNSKLFKCKKY